MSPVIECLDGQPHPRTTFVRIGLTCNFAIAKGCLEGRSSSCRICLALRVASIFGWTAKTAVQPQNAQSNTPRRHVAKRKMNSRQRRVPSCDTFAPNTEAGLLNPKQLASLKQYIFGALDSATLGFVSRWTIWPLVCCQTSHDATSISRLLAIFWRVCLRPACWHL